MSHKEWRKLAKKARRKRIRQGLAQARAKNEENERQRRELSPSYQAWVEEQKQLEEFQEKEEARLAVKAQEQWLKAEDEAQVHWKQLQEKLATARAERAQQAARIKEEWEREQKRLKEIIEKKEQEEEEKRKAQERLQEEINNFIEHGGEIPEGLKTKYETNPSKPTCPFFLKTGACRFKDTCSRNHIRPGISKLLLIPNFYSHYSLQQVENEHGSDFSLEFENQETYDHFKEFFYDVVPEMESCGQVRHFKVCCNHEVHLRGNVYVEYMTYREAIKSYKKFYGRFYGGKQLYVEFCKIRSWKSAICGLQGKKRCPKGTSCNFLHVFTNPDNLYNSCKDLQNRASPEFEEESFSEEYDARNWRWSESPERSPGQEHLLNTDKHHKRRRQNRSRSPRHSRTGNNHLRNGKESSSKRRYKKGKRSRSRERKRKYSRHRKSS